MTPVAERRVHDDQDEPPQTFSVRPPLGPHLERGNNAVTDGARCKPLGWLCGEETSSSARANSPFQQDKERVMQPEHSIHVFINKKKFDLDQPLQTGASLKQLAGIPSGDVLFLQQPGEDQVIANDSKITLKNGDHLHSQPPADYGLG